MSSHDHPIRVTSPDGASLAVWRSGSGPGLLLVHGTTADHTRWAAVSPLLEARFTVYAMDRRGRGGSTDGPSYSIAHEAADIVAVAESIGEPIHVLGHSYGAICCLEAAGRLPRLGRLVLYEPPLPTGEPMVSGAVREELERLSAAGLHEAMLLTFFREVVRVPEDQLGLMRASPAWAGRLAAAQTIPREIRIESEFQANPAKLATLRVPTLLLLGGDSPSFFRAATAAVHQAIPSSRIQEMPGQQHVAMDVAPHDFVGLVTAFLLEDS